MPDRTHCNQGHAFTPENTYYQPGTNWRVCRICKNQRKRARITSPETAIACPVCGRVFAAAWGLMSHRSGTPACDLSDADRFWAKVDATGDCWEWMGSTREGYGKVYIDGRGRGAHRVAWELLVGPIPTGLTIDHLCRNHGCVNPDHLEPVTVAENNRRGYSPINPSMRIRRAVVA